MWKTTPNKSSEKIKWQWLDQCWSDYDPDTTKKIEEAYQKNKFGSYTYTAPNRQTYKITFSDMMQENVITRYKRAVRRVVEKEEKAQEEEEEKESVIEVDHSSTMSVALAKYFDKQEFSDFVFYADEKPIYVHKIIISQQW